MFFFIIISAVAKKNDEMTINVAALDMVIFVLYFNTITPPTAIIPPMISIMVSRSLNTKNAKTTVRTTSNRDKNDTVAGSIIFSDVINRYNPAMKIAARIIIRDKDLKFIFRISSRNGFLNNAKAEITKPNRKK